MKWQKRIESLTVTRSILTPYASAMGEVLSVSILVLLVLAADKDRTQMFECVHRHLGGARQIRQPKGQHDCRTVVVDRAVAAVGQIAQRIPQWGKRRLTFNLTEQRGCCCCCSSSSSRPCRRFASRGSSIDIAVQC